MKQPRKPSVEPEKILFRVEGKMSTFGGPLDFGMQPDEGLALFSKPDLEDPKYAYLFLPAPPPGTSGLGRRLNPNKFYFACRWNYSDTPKEFLRRSLASVENPKNGRKVDAHPVDWGPHERTGRVADLSPGLAAALGLNTDDVVRITISAPRAIPVKVARVKRAGHGSSNPHAKPAIRAFIESPNHSSRNGIRIDKIVLHCTEASLPGTLAEFKKSGGRQVSAHYVIDRNGDIYQMVKDSDRANHCIGANESSIGIEHVGGENDQLAAPQAAASSALIRWLISNTVFRAQIFSDTILRPATPGPAEPAAPTNSSARCTRKQLSLPGCKRTSKARCEGGHVQALGVEVRPCNQVQVTV
jgi:hypothetical protein